MGDEKKEVCWKILGGDFKTLCTILVGIVVLSGVNNVTYYVGSYVLDNDVTDDCGTLSEREECNYTERSFLGFISTSFFCGIGLILLLILTESYEWLKERYWITKKGCDEK